METKKQTILIVDDTPTNIEVLAEVLSDDYEVLFATNGQDAFEVAVLQNPDLILLDVMMPGMDGYEACTLLKNDSRTQSIPVIFVTSLGQEEDETKGLSAGAIDYLTKPIRPPIFRARVRNHLELKRYRDFLENLSATDGLTGIFNRRRLDEVLENEWRRALRNQTPLSLILSDIDRFKDYNDSYGHLAGDDCLRQIARTLAECARRPSDLMARYGGEEFAGLLPETDALGAGNVATMMWEKVNCLNLPHVRSDVADHVTLSLGVATLTPVIGQPSCDLIRRADEFLYAAKRNGRNQIKGSV